MFRMPKSTSVPTFSENTSHSPRPTPRPRPTETNKQPLDQSYFQKNKYTNHNTRNTRNNQYKQYQQYPQSTPSQNIPLDYHLRLPSVIDNPKKIPKFDYIKVIPFGNPCAVYLQNNNITFFSINSDVAFSHIQHKTQANRTLFIATMVKSGFFVITDVIIYGGRMLSTNEERLTALLDIFSKGILTEISADITFTPTHLFSLWTDFTRGSLHIPYEIKHLEYCFYKEPLNKQTHRYIYILNKKNIKKSSYNADLVITNSREFRIDVDIEDKTEMGITEFKTSVLEGIPYYNIVGYSHLDKQEESDEEM
jgi:hypothetical protein